MNKNKIILIVVPILIVLILLALINTNVFVNPFSKHRQEVKKYLKENYKNEKLLVKYDYSTKCVLYEECVKKVHGLDESNLCLRFKKHYKPSCKEYHYLISGENVYFTLVVIKEDGKYRVESNSKNKNKDKEKEEEEQEQ